MLRWHKRTSLRLLFVLATSSFGTALGAPLAKAQSSATVDPSDPIYRSIDRFVAEGLIDTIVAGQRPYSRREIAKLVAQAARNRVRLEAGFADKRLGSREREALAQRLQYTNALIDQARLVYRVDVSTASPNSEVPLAGRLDRLTIDGALLSSPARSVPNGGIGGIDAITNPFVDDRQGRDYADGATGAMEAEAHGDFGRFFSLNVAGDARTLRSRGAATPASRRVGRVRVLSGSTILGNVRVDLGRDYVSWGQAPRGGLAFSLNAPALDLLRVSSDAPFVLPWVFRYLGPVRATALVADLGPHRDFPHAKLVSWKLSATPARRLELGVTVVDEMGGEGSPAVPFGDRLVDVLPFVDAVFFHKTNVTFSNKLAGGDLRLRIPEWRGLELYGDMLFDDFDLRRLRSSFTEDNGVIAGFTLPRLSRDGTFQLDGEWHHTGLRYYQHEQFTSGVTLHDRMLGDALGPRGEAIYGTVTWSPSVVQAIALRGAFEHRSNDQYILVSDGPDSQGFRFEKVQTLPKEHRQRLTLEWSAGSGVRGLRSVVEAGVENVDQFDFNAFEGRVNGLLRLAIEFRP